MFAKVLVTGAAGFIGYHTCIRLLENGWDVIAIDDFNEHGHGIRFERAAALKRFFNLEVQRISIFDTQAITKMMPVNAVVHLAAMPGVTQSMELPVQTMNVNVMGSMHLFELTKKANVPIVLYASSSSVYGNTPRPSIEDGITDPRSIYATSKLTMERVAGSMFAPHQYAVGMRFFTVYGEWGRPDMAYWKFADALMKGETINLRGGLATQRDFTYIDDVTMAIKQLLHRKGIRHPYGHSVVNVCGGKPRYVHEMIGLLSKYLGKTTTVEQYQLPEYEPEGTCGSTFSLQYATKFVPAIPLEYGLERFAEWFGKRNRNE